MSVNTLRLIHDHIEDEISDLNQEIRDLVDTLHQKQSRLATLLTVQQISNIHGGNNAIINGTGRSQGDESKGVAETRDYDSPVLSPNDG